MVATTLLCSQIARLPGKGWLTIGFLLLSVRSLLYIVSSGQPPSDDPAVMFGPWLVVGAIGCCLIGVVVGGAGQVAGSASLPGVGGWWSGLPWLGKAAIGLAVAGPVVGVLLIAAAMLHDESIREKYRYHSIEEDDHSLIHKSDIESDLPTVPPAPNGPDKSPPTPEMDEATRHNEAISKENMAADQLKDGLNSLAKEMYAQAALIQSNLADDFHDNPTYQYEAAVDYRHVGDLEADAVNYEEARKAYSEARSRLDMLHDKDPGNEKFIKELIAVCDGQGRAYENAGLADEAKEAKDKADDLRKSLPTDPDAKEKDKP